MNSRHPIVARQVCAAWLYLAAGRWLVLALFGWLAVIPSGHTAGPEPTPASQVVEWEADLASVHPVEVAGLGNVLEIAVGYASRLARLRDGTLVAWPGEYAARIPAGLDQVTAISFGAGRFLALKTDGTVAAWNENGEPHPGPPSHWRDLVAVAAGPACLALRADGTVVDWRPVTFTTRTLDLPPGLANVVALASGATHSLALHADGRVTAWGSDFQGESNVPATLNNAVTISAAAFTSWALKADGTLSGWGVPASAPDRYWTNVNHVASVSAGSRSLGLALLTNGTVTGLWGPPLPKGLTNVAAVFAGDSASVALLADGPPSIPPLAPFRAGIGGSQVFFHAMATGASPLSYQWSFEGVALPGETNTALHLRPLALRDAGNYRLTVSNHLGVAVSPPLRLDVQPVRIVKPPTDRGFVLGETIVLAVEVEPNGPLAWQWLQDGQELTGQTNATLRLASARFEDAGDYAVRVTSPFGSLTTSAARVTISSLLAWDSANPNGPRVSPPAGWTNVIAVDAGFLKRVLALKPDGSVLEWLPVGGEPLQIPGDFRDAVAVCGGQNHGLALRPDGRVVQWGRASFFPPPPVPAGLSNVVAVAASGEQSYALKADGTIVTWGRGNAFGPVFNRPDWTNVVALSAGYTETTVLRPDGSLSFLMGLTPRFPAGSSRITAVADPLFLGNDGSVFLAESVFVDFGNTYYGMRVLPGARDVTAIATAGALAALQRDGAVLVRRRDAFQWTTGPVKLNNVLGIAVAVNPAGTFPPSADVVLQVHGDAPPRILLDRDGHTVVSGAPLFWQTAVSGSRPVSYQWQFQGRDLPGQTSLVLQKLAVKVTDAGDYTLVASNRFGVARAVALTLDVLPLRITNAPRDQRILLGHSGVLEVGAEGTVTSYQWFKEGKELPGETGPALILGNAQWEDAGNYTVRLGNNEGSLLSPVARVEISQVAAWGDNFVGQTDVPSGLSNVVAVAAYRHRSLALKADGTSVSWGSPLQADAPPGLTNVAALALGAAHAVVLRTDGTVVAWGENQFGQTNVPSGLEGVVAIATTSNSCVALKRDGTVLAWGEDAFRYTPTRVPPNLTNVVDIDMVRVWRPDEPPPRFWADGEIDRYFPYLAGSPARALATTRQGAALFADEFGRLGVVRSLGAAPDFGFSAAAAEGDFRVTLTSDGRVVGSATLTNVMAIAAGAAHGLALAADRRLTLAPVVETRHAPLGSTVCLFTPATGALPLAYQWRLNGRDLPGRTNEALVLTNLAFADRGDYTLVVSNRHGATATAKMALVVPPLAIQQVSRPLTGFPGGLATLSVNVLGTGLRYQWRHNGAELAGATNATLNLAGLDWSDAGAYDVQVSNDAGSAVSDPMQLVVSRLVTWSSGLSLNWLQRPSQSPVAITNSLVLNAGASRLVTIDALGRASLLEPSYNPNPSYGNSLPTDLGEVIDVSQDRTAVFILRTDGKVAVVTGLAGPRELEPGMTNVVALAGNEEFQLMLRADGTVAHGGAVFPRRSPGPCLWIWRKSSRSRMVPPTRWPCAPMGPLELGAI